MRPGLVVIGLLGAALVGAFAGPLLAPPAPVAFDSDPDAHDRLAARVADLEREVVRLRAERAEPPLVPPAPAGQPSVIPGEVPTDAPVAAPAVEDARIESEVRKVIAEREQVARDVRAKQAAEKQAAKDQQFLAKLQAALDLTDHQRAELLGHLITRRTAYGRYRRLVDAPDATDADKARYRQAITDWVAKQDAQLTELLGVQKFERLMELTSPKKR